MQDFHAAFEIAQKVIRNVSIYVKSQIGKEQVIDKKDSIYQIVTETDTKAEILIREQLKDVFPEFGFIGEEGGSEEKEASWIIDPIDGTVGFEKNLPACAIVLGLKHKDAMVFSLIYRLFDDTLFSSYVGEGAYKNGQKISVSKTSNISDAVIGISHQHLWIEKYHDFIYTLIKKTRSFQIGFSSAVDSTYVAEGRLDGLVKVEQKLWDVAPECLLVKEAGGIVTDRFAKPIIYLWNSQDLHSFTLLSPELAAKHASDFYFTANQ